MSARVKISMAEIGEVIQNGYVERLIRTIKEEEVDLSEYEDYHDAYRHIGLFLDDVYMHKRIHSSLGYLTPVEYEYQWLTATRFARRGMGMYAYAPGVLRSIRETSTNVCWILQPHFNSLRGAAAPARCAEPLLQRSRTDLLETDMFQ